MSSVFDRERALFRNARNTRPPKAAVFSHAAARGRHPPRDSLSGLEPIRFSEATAPAILWQKFLQYPHIAAHFSLVYPKHLLTENCAHPSPKEFLTDFGDARRRKVWTFQGERRQKMRKFIGEGLVGSSPLRLPFPRRNSKDRRSTRSLYK